MTVNELIEQLECLKHEHGNLEVEIEFSSQGAHKIPEHSDSVFVGFNKYNEKDCGDRISIRNFIY